MAEPAILTLASIRKTEAQVKARQETQHKLTLLLVSDIVDTIYAGLPLTVQGLLSDSEIAANAMLANAVTTFVKTVDLAAAGYYHLAANLLRMTTEHWIGALYVLKYPKKANLWLDTDRETPTLASMTDAVVDNKEEGLLQMLAVLRRTLNRFAHLTPITWRGGFGISLEGNNEFRIGPSLNSSAFNSVLYSTLWIGSQLLQVVRLRGGTNDEAWMERAASVRQKVALWMRAYNKDFGSNDT